MGKSGSGSFKNEQYFYIGLKSTINDGDIYFTSSCKHISILCNVTAIPLPIFKYHADDNE